MAAFPFPLADQRALVRFGNTTVALLNNDAIWTEYLASKSKLSPADVATLHALVEEMHQQLGLLEELAVTVLEIFDRNESRVDRLFRQHLPELDMTAAQADWLERQLKRSRSAHALGSRSVRAVLKNANAERLALRAKLQRIRAGKFVQGDLSKGFCCDCLKAGVVGGCVADNVAGLGCALACLAVAILADC